MTEKLCVFCGYFVLEMGESESGYTELTSGSDTVIKCSQNRWQMDNYDTDMHFRHNIERAKTCPEYRVWPEKEGGNHD